MWTHVALACALWLFEPVVTEARQDLCLAENFSSQDALLVANSDGEVVFEKNKQKKCAPASVLKLLTSLAAIHHLGKSYRFQTEFYLDPEQNLKIKGYGDPMLVSEAWKEIADTLAPRVRWFKDLVLDDTYFFHDINIPGVGTSTNPYDAPNGALCSNFNTIFFKRDRAGNIISAEPQTPMTPLAIKKVRLLGLKTGRYNFSHNSREGALYAGELFVHFFRKSGGNFQGKIRLGLTGARDKLVYTYKSAFALEDSLKKMLEFSNNFMANQIFIALGARVQGPPGTLEKGVRVVSRYAKEVLHLNDIAITEGSGISRKNRLSALDILAVLKAFEPHRALLSRKGQVLFKSGTLTDVRARAGYIECRSGRPYYFVILLNSPGQDIDALTANIAKALDNCI